MTGHMTWHDRSPSPSSGKRSQLGVRMIVLQVIAVAVGTAVTLAVLVSALETVVLPRKGFTRIARFVFAFADRVLIHRWRNPNRAAHLRTLYAPIALVTMPLVWMLSVAIGFSFIFWGIGSGSAAHSFELSGSSLTTLGFSAPVGSARIWLTFVEAIIGLGLVALLIGYLPTIYSAHSERDKSINLLRPFAGTPPSPVTLIRNLDRVGNLDNPDLWRAAADELLNLEQSHGAFPALCYFPDPPDESWVASTGSLLDGAALMVSTHDYLVGCQRGRRRKGPDPDPRLWDPGPRSDRRGHRPPGGADHAAGRAPSARRASSGRLGAAGRVRGRTRRARRRGLGPRHRHRAVLVAVRLAPVRLRPAPTRPGRPHPGHAGPVDDRPARHRRPATHPERSVADRGLVRRRALTVADGDDYRWLNPPDSSLVMETVTGCEPKWEMAASRSSSRMVARSRLTPWRTRTRWTEMSDTEPVSG